MLRRVLFLVLVLVVAGFTLFWWTVQRPLPLPQAPFAFTVKTGASLRSVARELTQSGILVSPWELVALGRLNASERAIKAGSYEIPAGTTLASLLKQLTVGDVTQSAFTLVEGASFRDVKEAL